MLFKSLFGAVALATSTIAQSYPLELVYQFENSFSGLGYVNIENVAVRSSNGQLLLNFATGAIMAQLNPDAANPQPEVLVNLTATGGPNPPTSLTGIAETGHDVYTVAAGSFRFGPSVPNGIIGVNGSFSVWSIDLRGPVAKATKIVAIPEANSLNGVTTVPGNKDIVLIADSQLGTVWSVNIKTGAYSSVLSSPLFLPGPTNNFGINGIHARGSYLYFTNSAQNIFGAAMLDSTGAATGQVMSFYNGINGTFFDDFSQGNNNNTYIAAQHNAVVKVSRENGAQIIAGGGNDTTLLSPTATAIKGNTLYVVTGGQGGPAPQSGQVFAIDISGDQKKARRWTA